MSIAINPIAELSSAVKGDNMATISDIVGLGIDDTNNLVFAWFRNGMVSAGSSTDLSSKRDPQPYTLPKGKTVSDIVGMGIDGTNNLVFAWYRDGTVSAGTSRNLGAERPPAPYVLPGGKRPDDVVGMEIDGKNNLCFAWYRDGTVSAGSSRDLGSKRQPAPYVLADNKTAADVIDMGIDGLAEEKLLPALIDLTGEAFGVGKDDKSIGEELKKLFDDVTRSLVFAWYRDGTVSAGKSKALAMFRPASPFTL